MEHLADVTVDDLQQTLASVDEKTPALRLVAAIAYKNGVTQSELADWFDVERKTIYNWLTRFDHPDLDAAVRDASRGGRPRKLTDNQLETLEAVLHTAPPTAGYDVPVWTTAQLQAFIREEFGIEYSRPSCRRLLRGAGLQSITTREASAGMDPEEREAFNREVPIRGHVWLPD